MDKFLQFECQTHKTQTVITFNIEQNASLLLLCAQCQQDPKVNHSSLKSILDFPKIYLDSTLQIQELVTKISDDVLQSFKGLETKKQEIFNSFSAQLEEQKNLINQVITEQSNKLNQYIRKIEQKAIEQLNHQHQIKLNNYDTVINLFNNITKKSDYKDLNAIFEKINSFNSTNELQQFITEIKKVYLNNCKIMNSSNPREYLEGKFRRLQKKLQQEINNQIKYDVAGLEKKLDAVCQKIENESIDVLNDLPVVINECEQIRDYLIDFDWKQSKILQTQEEQEIFVELNQLKEPCRLKLIYQGSTHGFEDKDFHRECDGKAKTITLIKSELNKVFGAFTTQPWESSYFTNKKKDSNAYIFSITNNKKFNIKQSQYAIRCNSTASTIFGNYDIHIADSGNYTDFGNSYDSSPYKYESNEAKSYLAGSYKFKIHEIEVFMLS